MLRRIVSLILIITACLAADRLAPGAGFVRPAAALTTNIRVGFCAYMSPYQHLEKTGEPGGFHIELLEEVADDADLVLEYIPFETTIEAMDSLAAGDVDLVLGVTKRQFAATDALFSDPISTTNLCLVANKVTAERYRSNPKSVRYTVAEYGLIRYTNLSHIGQGVTIITGNQESGVELLLSERADMLVGVKESILWYLDQADRSDDFIIINNYLSSSDFCIAVRDGDRYLQQSINESLAGMRTSGTYDTLYGEWLDDSTIDYRTLLKIAVIALVGVVLYMLISYRQRAVQVEAESKLRYSIIESSPAAMVLIDKNYTIEYMNRSAMKMAEIREFNRDASLLNMKVFREIIEKAGGSIFNKEWTLQTGTIDFYKNHGRPVKEKYRYNIQKMTPHGNKQGALLTVENITLEEREREAAFEKEKNETLNSLIAGIAHEIKNPLTAINASASMIKDKGQSPKFREAFSTLIPQEIERITRLIDNLLNYARPGSSKIAEVDVAEVLRSVYELSRTTARTTHIALKIQDEDSLYLRGDKDKIKQALLNLMINSIEATKLMAARDKAAHSIVLEALKQDGQIIIRITDDGVGMTAYEAEKCTTPFYTTKAAGTGIGLSLTKQYIEEAGGSMQIKSEKDKYTRVEISLPALIQRGRYE